MKLICYANPDDEAGQRVRDVVHGLVPKSNTEVCLSAENLSRRLRQPGNGFSLAVLLTTSQNALSEILSLSDLLHDLRIILILPDRQKDTVARALTLRPRFLTFSDSDFTELSAVLGKMLKTYRDGRPTWKE
jgi:hypothetical protein